MITSGSIALTANKEYGRYMIKCSTGETIPVDASGAPVGQVAFTFYKVDTDGVMAAFSASQVYYELLASDGSSIYDDSLAQISLLDLTDDLTNYRGQFKSVRLTVYGTGHEVLAVQSFGTTEPGSDAEIYVISLTAAYYTMNGLKEINAKLAGKLYKRKGTTTTPVSGATVKFGYVNGSTTTAQTDSSGAFDDSDWFVGDVYTDTFTCNNSPSIFVSYELNGITQASQYVSLGQQGNDGKPGDDGVAYDIVLNTGETVPCTAYAELITDIISVTLLKNGTSIDFGIDLKIKDNNGNVLSSWMTGFYPGYQIQPQFAEAIATGTEPRSIYIRAFANVNGQNQVVTEKTFAVTYESPLPFVRKETEWNSGLTFRNGDIILIGGKIDLGSVFAWNCPISGNSAVDPKTDIDSNPYTTKWNALDYFNMVATNLLLAENAILAGWVFKDNKLFSQNNNCFLDGVTGQISLTGSVRNAATHLTKANISDYLSQDILGDDYIDFTKVGNLVWVDEDMDVGGLFMFPAFTDYHGLIGNSYDEVRSLIGSRFVIYNNMPTKMLYFTGALCLADTYYNPSFSSFTLSPGDVGFFECRLGTTSQLGTGNEEIYWYALKAKLRK
jgi:hypothetical protein